MRPYYLVQESLLRRNLQLIKSVADEADVEIILAFKAFALWRTFPIFRDFIGHTTASSLCEARLSLEEFGSLAHTYSPAYEEDEFDEILHCSGHVTFNSLSQYERFLCLQSNCPKSFLPVSKVSIAIAIARVLLQPWSIHSSISRRSSLVGSRNSSGSILEVDT